MSEQLATTRPAPRNRLAWSIVALNAVMLLWNLATFMLAPSWWDACLVGINLFGIACGLATIRLLAIRTRERRDRELADARSPHLLVQRYRDTLAQVDHAREWGLPTEPLIVLAELYRIEAGIPAPPVAAGTPTAQRAATAFAGLLERRKAEDAARTAAAEEERYEQRLRAMANEQRVVREGLLDFIPWAESVDATSFGAKTSHRVPGPLPSAYKHSGITHVARSGPLEPRQSFIVRADSHYPLRLVRVDRQSAGLFKVEAQHSTGRPMVLDDGVRDQYEPLGHVILRSGSRLIVTAKDRASFSVHLEELRQLSWPL